MNEFLIRSIQKVVNTFKPLLPWREPELIVEENGLLKAIDIIKTEQMNPVTIVTDQGILDAIIADELIEQLDQANIDYHVFSEIEANPAVDVINQLIISHNKHYAKGFLAIGGGSVLDATKAAAALKLHPDKDLADLQGLMKVVQETQPIIAVPTTAGTGSEGTLAAVVSDPHTVQKYAIMTTSLIPKYAILDAKVTQSLPAKLTAETGMDALTHAVEAYTNLAHSEYTESSAKEAVELIAENLKQAYEHPDDLAARENMLIASYKAGQAFHIAYVGNVHALSHALSAYYHLPHGRTNATILPIVLELYGDAVYERLADLARLIHLDGENDAELAKAFIQWIKDLNQYFDIPTHIPEIQNDDLEKLAEHADNEANPLYTVPVIFNQDDFINAYKLIKGDA